MDWMAAIVMWSYGLGGKVLPKARFERFASERACEAFATATRLAGYRQVHHDGIEIMCVNVARGAQEQS